MKAFLLLIFVSFLFISCNKDPEQKGCCDPIAENYDPGALEDDGSCTFNTNVQVIWKDGEFFGWDGNNFTGNYVFNTCMGSSAVTETMIDSVTTKSHYTLTAGGNGNYFSYISLINSQDARTFGYGNLKFDLKTDSIMSPTAMHVFINGKITDTNANCENILRSEFVEINTSSLNDSTYTTVSIPLDEFENRRLGDISLVCGFSFQSIGGSSIAIDNIRLTAAKEN